MSEILIRGMEIPEHCGECKLKAEYNDETLYADFLAQHDGIEAFCKCPCCGRAVYTYF